MLAWLGTGIASLGLLVWLAVAGPGYLGYGTALLWTGPHRAPMYDIHVTPGNAVVRRNASQLVTAQPEGVNTDKVRIYTRYRGASKFEQVTMQPQPGAHGFQFLFAGIPEDVEYYVEAGKVQSRHFQLRVADVPSVVQIRVRYHYPDWTGLPDAVEESGGDLKAIAGTAAQLEILTDRPLRDGVLVLDDGRQVPLLGGDHNRYRGALMLDKDGTYHVAALEQRQPVRLSEGLLHRGEPAAATRGRDRQADARLSGQSDRGGHDRRQGQRCLQPDRIHAALWPGQRRPG